MSSFESNTLFTVNRVEAFSDGVLAIVITLLVLEIKIPELPPGSDIQETLRILLKLWPKFASFLLSFLFVAVFWVNHHRFFSLIRSIDWGMLWLNNLLLLFLCFVPFPTGFLGDHPKNPVAVCFFAIVFMLAGVAFNLMWRYARRRLPGDAAMAEKVRKAIRRGLVGPMAYGSAAILAFVHPLASWVIFFAVPIYYAQLERKKM